MKKLLSVFMVCGLTAASAVSCAGKGETSSATVETTAAATTAGTATEAETEPATEPTTTVTVEYYDGLICSENMTDKEKERSSFREFTLLDPAKCFALGKRGRNSYCLDPKEFESIAKIQDNFHELAIYDEQMDTPFLVHIITPPNYDENKEYPVFFLTDEVFWMEFIPIMWDLIDKGEISPVIFVTHGYEYSIDAAVNETRVVNYTLRQDKFLDFITDDLMKTISLNYKIDESRSVLFGHSSGGPFADYALCNSDRYEYQPFKNYIIGSPAFCDAYYDDNPYKGDIDLSVIKDPYAFQREFDYFERNETMDKNVFICVGEKEDIQMNCGDGDDMVEGTKKLYERLKSHGANAELHIYEGCFHTNYLKGMLMDYLKQNFPPEDKTQN
ncbi:alpha/beta hydrolase-fold protein [Ruminococcus sp.]|uniref:alpha/beta hydrolase n=1 Tax=Ruminococcus sp. TaxID=41978 RepID=UPI0025E1D591|nr:alpha/beta hydrolase-fold protein [Ruminococcus sp.]MBQ6252092.1 alpha/beta hydrolase fold domain-containing protein [Ruminococcus sp.]